LGGSASGGCGGGVFLFFCLGGASGLLDGSAARGLDGSLRRGRGDEGTMACDLRAGSLPSFFSAHQRGGGLLVGLGDEAWGAMAGWSVCGGLL